MSHNIDADSLVGLSNISDYDVTVNKSAELAGQDCDVSLGIQNIKSVRTDEGERARTRTVSGAANAREDEFSTLFRDDWVTDDDAMYFLSE